MKCAECSDRWKCGAGYDLRRKRRGCEKAKKPAKRSNADRIRSMTDEELAEWFAGHDAGLVANVLNNDYVEPTKDGWLEWLKEESTE